MNYKEIFNQIENVEIATAKKQKMFNYLNSKSYFLDSCRLISDGLVFKETNDRINLYLDMFYPSSSVSGNNKLESSFQLTCKIK